MFFEAANFELEQLDKSIMYSFVLLHKDNRIVCPVPENRVILVEARTRLGEDSITNLCVSEVRKHLIDKHGFTEESLPNFFGSSYSIVKGFTDRMMHMFENNTLNLRIRMPITASSNKRNFITKIVSYEKICSIQVNGPSKGWASEINSTLLLLSTSFK